MAARYFVNRLPDPASKGAPATLDAAAMRASLRSTLEYVLPSRDNLSEPSVYTGGAGIAFLLWRLAANPSVGAVHAASEAVEGSLEYARHALQQQRELGGRRHRCSLFAGEAGALCVAALSAHAAARHEARAGRMQRSAALVAEASECVDAYREMSGAVAGLGEGDEVLYGRAGYLLGCLQLNRHVRAGAVSEDAVRAVAEAVLHSGRRQARGGGHQGGHRCPLRFAWHGSHYLGAAHGLMGILHVLLLLPAPILDALPGARDDVRAALLFVLSLECDADGAAGEAGFWPTYTEPGDDRKEPLVHWCHGSTGAVFLFAQAHEACGEAPGGPYLRAALRGGEAVWERGLLRKGPGACHGVSGSAYALLRLWRATGDKAWLHRAAQFALFMRSEEFQLGARTPDRPASLFEGWAAAACLYADLLQAADARFPLFEL